MLEGKRILRLAFKDLERELPQRVARGVRGLRHPKARYIRIPVAVLSIVGGVFSFLPVLGLWMLPLGLLLLAHDVPFLRKPVGHVTVAEIVPNPEDYPGALPHMIYAGSLTFTPPSHAVDLRDYSQWWSFTKGANWRHPHGPKSNINALDNHPVVHVAFHDALAYAQWAGKELPSEAEWEFAARGGLDGVDYAWGDELTPNGRHMANTWQGEFPRQNTNGDGFERTSPVTAFPPNGHGVYDMIGNVWEWTADWYSQKHQGDAPKACCIPQNPRGGSHDGSYDPATANVRIPRKVIKGGSHLCAPNYCRRYRPAARHAEQVDTSASHLGFRCIRREGVNENHNGGRRDV